MRMPLRHREAVFGINLAPVPYLTWILILGSLAVAGWAGIRTIRDQPVIFKQLILAGGVLGLMLITMIVAAVEIFRGHPIPDPVLFWGYYIAGAILFPVAGIWSIAERTRWSSVVLLVAGLSFAVVQWRLYVLWMEV